MDKNKSNAQKERSETRSVRDTVLEKIKDGKTRMRPRWYFILQTALVAVGAVILFIALLYVASFIHFVLYRNGVWFITVFGWRGVEIFLVSLPWVFILSSVIFIFLLETLVNHFSFGYRKPLLYSLLVIIVVVMTSSIVISQTSLHEDLNKRAWTGELPVVGQLYRDYDRQQNRNVHIGAIGEITEYGFNMKDRQGGTLTVIVTPETSFPLGLDFQKGDYVVVLGELDNGTTTVQAFGIRTVNDDLRMRNGVPIRRGWFKPPMMQLSPDQ